MATIAQQNTDILLSNLNKEFPSIEEGYSQVSLWSHMTLQSSEIL
jgi:hypothetical protein